MKGIVIFDDKSDMAYFSLDKEMEKYVIDRMNTLEQEAGANVDPSGGAPLRDMRDRLSAFCLPFFTSFDVLNTLKKPIFSITGEDGFLIVFRKFGEHVYIALSKEDGDTEETLVKKLFVFNRITTLLYGPVHSKLSPPDVANRKAVWAKLSSVFSTYENLYLTDQVYLVEALEHVQFGQLTAAANVVQKLTRDSLEASHNGGLTGVRHAMLLVNTKFLSMCGKSPRIETADILLITLLVYHHFHNQEKEDSKEEEGEDVTENGEENSANPPDDGGNDSGDELPAEFSTPCSTPGPVTRSIDHDYETIPEDFEPGSALPGETAVDLDDARAEFKTPVGERPDVQSQQTPPVVSRRLRGRVSQSLNTGLGSKAFPSKLKNALASIIRKVPESNYSLPPNTHDVSKFYEQTVFLQPHKDHFIPHMLYCLQVYHGIVLVMVAEHPGVAQLAGNICQTLLHISSIFGSNRNASASGQGIFDIIEDSIKRIKEQIQREASYMSDPNLLEALRIQTGNALRAWANLKLADFRTYLEQKPSERNKGPNATRNFTRMDACATDLKERLMKVFDLLYLSPKKKEYNTVAVVSKLMKHFNSLNQDYGEFLALKGVFNIPMVSFSMSFPGMIHFIHIDRSFDELMAPSLTADGHVGIPYVEKAAKKTGENASVFLRRKIWCMVQRVQRFLGHGYSIQTWLDEDFLYVYYLWINIPNNPLGAPIRFYSLSNIKGGDYCQPGVVGSSFYADVHNLKEGYMYELYAVFETRVSIKEASEHCRSLAEQLWPSSRESIAPFSLIN